MVMRRAGKASPEAINAERTRSRASETALSGRPTIAKAGIPGCNLHLHIDWTYLDPLEGHCRDALDHLGLTPTPNYGFRAQVAGAGRAFMCDLPQPRATITGSEPT